MLVKNSHAYILVLKSSSSTYYVCSMATIIIGEVLILHKRWLEIESTLQPDSTYFIMIFNHSKFTINIG
jgi:hypothetical protein